MAGKRQQLPALIAAPDTMPVPEILRRAPQHRSRPAAGKPGLPGPAQPDLRGTSGASHGLRDTRRMCPLAGGLVVRVGPLRRGAA